MVPGEVSAGASQVFLGFQSGGLGCYKDPAVPFQKGLG